MSDSTAGWTAGYERKSFAFGGGTISWLQLTESMASQGDPVVLVHGMQGSALEHCELGRRLATTGPVYLPDLRAHGQSSAAPGNPAAGSMADQVQVIAAFLREVVGRPAVLAGNSFGAMICANVTRDAPDLVQRLVLIGPAMRPARRPIEPVRFLQWLVAKPQWVRDRVDGQVRAGKRPEDTDTLVATGTPYLDLVPSAFLDAFRAAPEPAWSIDNAPGRASLWRSRNDALVMLSRPRMCMNLLNTLVPPILWLHGSDDPQMRPAGAEEIQELLPGGQVATIAATGHVPHLERVDWTAEQISAWLRTKFTIRDRSKLR